MNVFYSSGLLIICTGVILAGFGLATVAFGRGWRLLAVAAFAAAAAAGWILIRSAVIVEGVSG